MWLRVKLITLNCLMMWLTVKGPCYTILVNSQNAGTLEIQGILKDQEISQEATVSQSSHNVPRKLKEHRSPGKEILVPVFKKLVKKIKVNSSRLPELSVVCD